MPENLTHIETLARAHTDAAIKTLAEIMTDPSAPARVRSAAAAVLRGFCAVFRVATPLVTGERLGHFTSETNDLANQIMPTNYHSRNPRGQQRDKPFREALRLELAAAGDDLKKLREIAAALIEKAAVGDLQAIKELADRLDGKPALALEHAVPENGGIRRFVREIVHVTETREEIENQDLVVDFHEIRPRNGNGGVDEN